MPGVDGSFTEPEARNMGNGDDPVLLHFACAYVNLQDNIQEAKLHIFRRGRRVELRRLCLVVATSGAASSLSAFLRCSVFGGRLSLKLLSF